MQISTQYKNGQVEAWVLKITPQYKRNISIPCDWQQLGVEEV